MRIAGRAAGDGIARPLPARLEPRRRALPSKRGRSRRRGAVPGPARRRAPGQRRGRRPHRPVARRRRAAGRLGHAGWVWSLCALGGSGLLSASEDAELAWWDARRGERVASIDCGAPLRSVDVRADAGGACVAFAGVDGRVRLAYAVDGALRCERDWPAHEAAVRRVRWLGDGRLVSCGEDGRVRVWSGEGTLLYERRHDNFATDALLLEDGRLLSCGYDGVLRTG
ncbi:hypothetical protein FE772_24900 [Lysobacter enzymogenes]|nr:hypothetical protein FE772_24900 [Lysobacter enzymogenes]